MAIYRLLQLGCLFTVVSAIDFSIKFENGDPVPSQVNVIENYPLLLRCMKNDPGNEGVRIVWRRYGDDTSVLYNTDLAFTSIQIAYDGDYYCQNDINQAYINVTIRVLFPPSRPAITGPKVVEKETRYSLNCSAGSNPAPTYYWTTEDSKTAQVVARGPTYTANLESNIDVYCWVENTMFPTQGDSVTIAQYQKTAITAIYAAYIWELYNSYTFNVSTSVIVDCRISGFPYPRVYWTKDGDQNFRFDGERLFITNVQMDFTGYYSCHAENDLQPSGLPKRVGSDVKNTLRRIIDPGIDDLCEATCQDRVIEALESCPKPTASDPCTDGCDKGLIAALVVGWIIASILLITFMFCCIKNCDKKRKANEAKAAEQENEFTRPKITTEERLASRPVLPVRPDVSRRQDEGTYAYISADGERLRPLPVSKMSGKYDYVEPNPVEKHDYLILNPPSPARLSRNKPMEDDAPNDIQNGFSNPTSSSFIHPPTDSTASHYESETDGQIPQIESPIDNYLEPVKTETQISQ